MDGGDDHAPQDGRSWAAALTRECQGPAWFISSASRACDRAVGHVMTAQFTTQRVSTDYSIWCGGAEAFNCSGRRSSLR
jgi:hypothetical protein